MSDHPHSDNKPERLPNRSGFDPHEEAAYGDDTIHSVHQQLEREKEEPTEGFSPIPIFLLFIFGGLVFWAGIYIANNSGEFRPDIYNPEWVPGGGGNETAAAWDPIKRGDRLFRNNCAACHQADGNGVPGSFPPLDGSPWVVGDEARLVKILLRGLQGPVEVMGNTYNGAMPSYGENGLDWSDRDIHAITTYVRQSWGNGAPPISEETVAAVRAEIADKSGAWSAPELLEMHPME